MKLSKNRFDEYKKELAEKIELLDKARKRLNDAREYGDLSENAEYETARNEVRLLTSDVEQLQKIMNEAEVISTNSNSKTISIGDRIKVTKIDGDTKEPLAEPREFVLEEKGDTVIHKILSSNSPLGKQILGKYSGIFFLPLNGGVWYNVEKIFV